MKNYFIRVVSGFAILAFFGSGIHKLTLAADSFAWENKVDPQVFDLAQRGDTDFLVVLKEQADLDIAASFDTKLDKGIYVFETLTSLAAHTQKPIRETLDSLGVTYHSFWVVNLLWVRGNSEIIQSLAQRTDVARIHANPAIQFSEPKSSSNSQPQTIDGIEWNISQINAPVVWSLGYTGKGIVVGGQDTGYIWDHPALKNQYRGWDGATVDHNYNWHDATSAASSIPIDPHGHGTHTMGTMVGDDSGGSAIGVAPGADWIGCRNMDASGFGTPATYIECYQWFIAPTNLSGNNPNPGKAPDVINNSWSCTVGEGCIEPSALITVVQNVRAAGIVTVHSAGNAGPGCETVNAPAALYDESYTVGATDSKDTIASFSSRGPVTIDSSRRLKPDISAPGVNIRSSTNDGSYGIKNGTSMAAPHVAGQIALLLSAQPDLIGQVDNIETVIKETAVPLYPALNGVCAPDTVSSHPNNTYGYGRIDAWAALRAILDILYFPIIYK